MNKEKVLNIHSWFSEDNNKDQFKKALSDIIIAIKHSSFRKVKGELLIGFEDPAKLSKILSAIAVFYPKYYDKISVKPCFDEDVLEGELHIEGHIRLIHILVLAFRIYTNKELMALIDIIRKENEKGDEDGGKKQSKRNS